MLITNYVCEEITKLTQPFKKSIENEKVKLRSRSLFSKGFVDYELNIDEYVHFSNAALQKISNNPEYKDSIVDMKMNYIENIFDMLSLTKKACTGKINLEYNLFVNKPELYQLKRGYMDNLNTLQKTMTIEYITKDSTLSKINIPTKDIADFINMRRLVKKIYKRLEESTCKYGDFTFNSIALGNYSKINITDEKMQPDTEGHSNLLLVMKDTRKNVITIILYEPHGRTDKEFDLNIKLTRESNNYFITVLQSHLEHFYKSAGTPYIIDILEQKFVSCPNGIQTYVNDSLGYCELISTLWLYLVLGLFSSTQLHPDVKILLIDRLQIVEGCLYRIYKTPQELYNVVVNFSATVINNYLKLINSEKLSNDFIRNFVISMNEKFKHNTYLKIIHRDDTPTQLQLGESNCKKCKRKNDCKSRNCVNRICSPPNFYTKYQDKYKIKFLPGEIYKPEGNIPKTIGQKCTLSKECCSSNCKDGYCAR